MVPSILLVGCRSYLGYNIGVQLKAVYDLNFTPDDQSEPFRSVGDLKKAFRERLNTQHIDWILITPYPEVEQRRKVFQALKEVLSEAMAIKADKLPGIMFFSQAGTDEMAKHDGRKILAQLFEFEKFLFSSLKASAQAIVIIRVAMLQEQLFFLLPGIFKRTWSMPIETNRINPVAIQDVIDFTRKVIDPRNRAKVHRQIFTLTGDGWPREIDHIFGFLKRNNIDVRSPQCTDLFLQHDGEARRVYTAFLGGCEHRAVNAPFWPSDTEVQQIKEYLWYAGWKGDPAAATSPDFEFLLHRKPRSAYKVIEEVIKTTS